MTDSRYLRVTTRWLYERVTGLYPSRSLRLFNHAQRDAILDTSSGIEILQFGIYCCLYSQALWYFVQPHHGRVADLLCNGVQHCWWDRGLRHRRHDGRALCEGIAEDANEKLKGSR
jgi:hypothetical protein